MSIFQYLLPCAYVLMPCTNTEPTCSYMYMYMYVYLFMLAHNATTSENDLEKTRNQALS